MPRAANGTYSLPAGNPVATLTVIASAWANTTMSDISTALTDSLSRSGLGSMTAPFKATDGAIGAPGLTWGTEVTSGWYRAGAGDFRFAIGGADIIQLVATGLVYNQPITISGTGPRLILKNTGGAADTKITDIIETATQFLMRTRTDADGAGATFFTLSRTATVVDSINMSATLFTFTGLIDQPKIRQIRENYNAVTWNAGANNLDLNAGNLHRILLQGNVTLAFTNPPPNSTLGVTVTIFLLQDGTGSRTVTWPASVHWSDGLTPVLTTTANRMDAVALTTFDGGTTYYGGQVLANMVP